MAAISVLVAAYNAEQTLARCLDSLCGQSLRDIQVVCIDDCSTDATPHILRRYADADPRIVVLETAVNSGQAVARNLGLTKVTAPYVCMVDADDWLSPDALQSALEVFTSYSATDVVLFRLCYWRVAPATETGGVEEPHVHEHPLPQTLSRGSLTGTEAFERALDGWQVHGLYVTRTSLNRAYPYDTTCRLYSDDNTTFLHYLHSREVRLCQGVYYYRQHPASMTQRFSIYYFDHLESDLSLLFTLRKEHVRPQVLRRFEMARWRTFLGVYRQWLRYRYAPSAGFLSAAPSDTASPLTLSAAEHAALQQRLITCLHTFRPSRLPWRCRLKPGYWLLFNARLFDLQQRAYVCLWERLKAIVSLAKS